MTEPRKVQKRLTPADKEKIRVLYESGEFVVADIAPLIGVSEKSISNEIRKGQIVKGAQVERLRAAIRDELKKEAEADAKELAKRIRESKEEVYRYAKALDNQVIKEIADARTAKLPVSSAAPNIKTLKLAAEHFKITKDLRWAALGLDKDEADVTEIPILEVDELTDDEIEDIRSRQEAISGVDIDEDGNAISTLEE